MGAEQADNYFAKWLDRTLTNRQMRGRVLARCCGVHDSVVSRWRSGRATPSLEMTTTIAKALNVEPLRLIVTVGLMDEEVAGVEALPLPEPSGKREHVRQQISRIRGLTKRSREVLLETYDEMVAEEDGKDAGRSEA